MRAGPVMIVTGLLLKASNPFAATLNEGQQTALDSATSANQNIQQYAGDRKAIYENLTKPLVSSAPMTQFNGDAFSVQLGCETEKAALELTVIPGAGGDIQQLQMSQDLTNDGTLDIHVISPFSVSGICANGVVSCEQGTWHNCRFYRWNAGIDGKLQFDTVSNNQLGGCYCVNNSCGTNLVQRNLHNVLTDLSGGAMAAMAHATHNFTPTRFEVSGLTGKYFVSVLGDCGNDSQTQTSYLDNPSQLSADAFSQAKNDSTYELITQSAAAQQSQSSVSQCTIQRRISLTHEINQVPSCTPDTWFAVSQSAKDFDTGGEDAWVEAQAFCNPEGPLRLRFRAWDGSGKSHCNARMDADGEGFVETMLSPDNSISKGFKMTYPNLRGSRCFDVPVFYQGGCLSNDGWCTFQFSFYDGSGNEIFNDTNTETDVSADFSNQSCVARNPAGWPIPCIDLPSGGSVIYERKTEITLAFNHPHITSIPDVNTCRIQQEWTEDQCQSLQADSDCHLTSEFIDGTQTIIDYQSTGNVPLTSAVAISDGVCDLSISRDWWQKQRTYRCAEQSTYDLSGILERTDFINRNTDSENQIYKGKRLENNKWIEDSSVSRIELPFPAQTGCTLACKTQKIRQTSDVASFGIEATLRINNDTYDYFYHECDNNNQCPVEAGESLVAACACLSEFDEAASMINMFRHAAKDTKCTSGIPREPVIPLPVSAP